MPSHSRADDGYCSLNTAGASAAATTARIGVVFGVDGLPLQRQEASGGAHPGAADQPTARTERVIDRAVGDAGPLSHRADRDGLDAALDREFFGRVEHRVAVVAPVAVAWPPR